MKVAILTQPLGHNYGGLLQAYALQCTVKSLGCSVETIDRRKPLKPFSFIYLLRLLLRLWRGKIKSFPTQARQTALLASLLEFRNRNLQMSPLIETSDALRAHIDTHGIDAVVVGSDQVWRPRYSPELHDFYLEFLDQIDRPVRRLSYAASFGVEEWEYSDAQTEYYRPLVQKFDAVSVREHSAIKICAEKFGVAADWHVDPTLLLEPEDYDRLIGAERIKSARPMLVSYILDADPIKIELARSIAKARGLDMHAINPHVVQTQILTSEIKKFRLPEIDTWLCAFRTAEFVVTDSFHGTVFAILFNKPFLAVSNAQRGRARFDSLLAQFDLSERLVLPDRSSLHDLVETALRLPDPDWIRVNERRVVLASAGRDFLKAALFGHEKHAFSA